MFKVRTVDHDQHFKHFRELETCQRFLVYCEAKTPDGKICFRHILRDLKILLTRYSVTCKRKTLSASWKVG